MSSNLFHVGRTSETGGGEFMQAHLTILTQGGEQNITFKMSMANFMRAVLGERVRISDLTIHNRVGDSQ